MAAAMAAGPSPATTSVGASDLDKAVAAMRGINPAEFEGEKAKAKGEELTAAWKTLIAAGPAGAARLKQEATAIQTAGKKDDFFKLGAAAVLWQIGRLDEVSAIVGLWSGETNLTCNYDYVFYLAFEAAMTQDPRAEPVLVAVLRDHEGSVFVPQHAMNVEWPLTHEFIWGAYGSKGLGALERVLAESKDETTVASAVRLLAAAHHLPALERIRALARTGSGKARAEAIKALGEFGHPEDYTLLVSGLKARDPKEVWNYAFALYEYEDLRAVGLLIPLLASPDMALRLEVTSCLAHLATPEGLAALKRHASSAPDGNERKKCGELIDRLLRAAGTSWDAYAAMSAPDKAKVMAGLAEKQEAKYRPMPGDRAFSHDDLVKAAGEWMQNGRITGGTYEWVEDRHVMAAATASDIPLLLDVKAKCYRRLSDECLYEAATLNGLIRRLGRARYRKVVGVCERVEEAASQPAPRRSGP